MANGDGPRTISLHTGLQLGTLFSVLGGAFILAMAGEARLDKVRADVAATTAELKAEQRLEVGRLDNAIIAIRAAYMADVERVAAALTAHAAKPSHEGTSEKLAAIEPTITDLRNQLNGAMVQNSQLHENVQADLSRIEHTMGLLQDRQEIVRERLAGLEILHPLLRALSTPRQREEDAP